MYFLNGQRTQTDTSPKKIYYWPISTSRVEAQLVREMHIKTTMHVNPWLSCQCMTKTTAVL